MKFDKADADYEDDPLSKVFKISKQGEETKVWEELANCRCGKEILGHAHR